MALRRTKQILVGLSLSCFLCTTGYAAAPPLQPYSTDSILLKVPPGLSQPLEQATPGEVAKAVRGFITRNRQTDDPRFLGYARASLNRIPVAERSEPLILLAAIIDQSLHDFDAARAALGELLSGSDDGRIRLQAQAVLLNLEIVTGHYERAGQLCDQLSTDRYPLIRANCSAQIQALTGTPEQAYEALAGASNEAPPNHPYSAFVQNTLGDIAAQLGKSTAPSHWLRALSLDQSDLYARTALADWNLQQGELDQVLSLTDNYQSVDRLAVLRAIAQKRSGQAQTELMQTLEKRFEEASWRSSSLHGRDMARYLLDVADEPDAALEAARQNWTDQKELVDTRLLLRAASQAGNARVLAQVRDWLAGHGQTDERFKGNAL